MKVVWAPRAEKQVDEAMAHLSRVGVEVVGVQHHARDLLRAVVKGLADLEDGRELDLAEVKRQLELD